jgi:hypothetical protein
MNKIDSRNVKLTQQDFPLEPLPPALREYCCYLQRSRGILPQLSAPMMLGLTAGMLSPCTKLRHRLSATAKLSKPQAYQVIDTSSLPSWTLAMTYGGGGEALFKSSLLPLQGKLESEAISRSHELRPKLLPRYRGFKKIKRRPSARPPSPAERQQYLDLPRENLVSLLKRWKDADHKGGFAKAQLQKMYESHEGCYRIPRTVRTPHSSDLKISPRQWFYVTPAKIGEFLTSWYSAPPHVITDDERSPSSKSAPPGLTPFFLSLNNHTELRFSYHFTWVDFWLCEYEVDRDRHLKLTREPVPKAWDNKVADLTSIALTNRQMQYEVDSSCNALIYRSLDTLTAALRRCRIPGCRQQLRDLFLSFAVSVHCVNSPDRAIITADSIATALALTRWVALNTAYADTFHEDVGDDFNVLWEVSWKPCVFWEVSGEP